MKHRKRLGFTLPEVLVTVAIIATLAAVLLPALIGQVGKGDSARAAEDLLAVQTGITAFVSDVRRYPSELDHLTSAVSTTDFDLVSSTYPGNLVAKWKGPYLSKRLTNGDLKTTLGGDIKGQFTQILDDGATFLGVQIAGMSLTDFNKLDEIIDEVANSSTGLLRYNASNTTSFLATPVQ
ncbi:MAG: prepilin-type N-terminal cleavage/methylation domain-containing protein [Gemmatimonadaceae bacterium]|nr:prepilin-type N-terminal cleavage/methylation domain-containing protein [Gemmatimonadaceae bacterium]